MADAKKEGPAKGPATTDTKGPAGGPKTTDSTRNKDVDNAHLTEGANRDLQDRRQNTFGDHTSSSSAANNPGQHGRDGGEINGTGNNPAPSEEVIEGERADDTNKEG